jgi:PAS domain S-box-containing protein
MPRAHPRQAELKQSLLFDHNPQPMLAYERSTLRLVAVSNAMVANYGYSREELLAMTLVDLFTDEDNTRLLEYLTVGLCAELPGLLMEPEYWRHRYKDGTIIEVDITGDDLELDGRSCRVLHCQDVTARNKATTELLLAREQLAASEARYRMLFDHNPLPMVVYDRVTLEIVAASNEMAAVYGYSLQELMSLTVKELRPPEDVESYLDYIEHVEGQGRIGVSPGESHRHQYKDGTIVDVEVTGDDVTLDGRQCRLALCLDVSLRNEAAAALVAARDQAVEASNMKSAFLANMSHEIRTPMNGVIGMNGLLLEMDLTDEQRALAEQVALSGEQMLSIINDILDISKIETGHLELDVTDFELHDAIEQTCSGPRLSATAKGLKLDLEIAPGVPRRMRGDVRRLQQVLLNLVANAVKFTVSGGVGVRVGARPGNGGETLVRIEVSDTGVGLDPASLQRMFEPFTQADVSTTRNYGGTGLGLAIARELVTLMGGTLDAESRPGHGSTFWFEVALLAPRAANVPLPQPDATAVAARAWPSPPLVLIAEDTPVNQIVAARALERCGCRVEMVSDGHAALDALTRQHFDAVLMDCQMPGMDGYEATRALRRTESAGQHTPVIAMTAQAMSGDRERCMQAGMDDYICKPMRYAELADALRRWIPAGEPGHSAQRSLATRG